MGLVDVVKQFILFLLRSQHAFLRSYAHHTGYGIVYLQ